MLIKSALQDLQKYHAEFVYTKQRPQLARLNVWGKQRFFLAKYFNVVEESYERQQIVLRYDRHCITLNLLKAPDFMDEDTYLGWLKQQFDSQGLV